MPSVSPSRRSGKIYIIRRSCVDRRCDAFADTTMRSRSRSHCALSHGKGYADAPKYALQVMGRHAGEARRYGTLMTARFVSAFGRDARLYCTQQLYSKGVGPASMDVIVPVIARSGGVVSKYWTGDLTCDSTHRGMHRSFLSHVAL